MSSRPPMEAASQHMETQRLAEEIKAMRQQQKSPQDGKDTLKSKGAVIQNGVDNTTARVRAIPGKPYPPSPSDPSSPSRSRWGNTHAAQAVQKRTLESAQSNPPRSNNVMVQKPTSAKSEPGRQTRDDARKKQGAGEKGGVSDEDEEGEEEEDKARDEIVEPDDEIPAPKAKAVPVVPKPTKAPKVGMTPQPSVDLGSKSAGAAHYGRVPTSGSQGPRRAGIWRDGSVEEDYKKQKELEESAVEKKPKKGKKGDKEEKKPFLDTPGILDPDDQDDMLPWGTLVSSPEQSEFESIPDTSSKRPSSGSESRVEQRSKFHVILTHGRGGELAGTVTNGRRSLMTAVGKNGERQEIQVGDHIFAVRGGQERKAIVTGINSAGEISVVWDDGAKGTVLLSGIRGIAVKISEILPRDRIQGRRGSSICNALVKMVNEDGTVVVDWSDGKGIDCVLESKDILKVYDIGEDEDEGCEEDGTALFGEKSKSSKHFAIAEEEEASFCGSDTRLEAVRRAEASRSRASIRIAKKVNDAIDIIPMNQDLTWSEFSRSCYDRFGRIHIHECHCGGNFCGVSGVCRRCGKRRGHHLPRSGVQADYICWTEDLHELASPLLEKNMKLNHSQQQFALRAVAQRLKTPPYDWKGPGTPLKSAVDAERSELVYVMLQGGLDPDEPDNRGVTPLHAASFLGRADICRLLLDGRATSNVVDRHGQSPLFFAPHTQICRLLYGFDADLNMVNNNGQTALHFAARAGLRDVSQWLTERSNKADLKDVYGVTAAQYMVLSCPEIADEALTPASHCFTNPGMRPGRCIGHHRLPEPRWEISRRQNDDGGNDTEAKGNKRKNATERKWPQKALSKASVEQ